MRSGDGQYLAIILTELKKGELHGNKEGTLVKNYLSVNKRVRGKDHTEVEKDCS